MTTLHVEAALRQELRTRVTRFTARQPSATRDTLRWRELEHAAQHPTPRHRFALLNWLLNSDADPSSLEQELAQEARRVLCRYVDEVVLPLNLCPWARGSLSSGKLMIEPICATFSGIADARRAAQDAASVLARADADLNIELVMIPFPRLEMGRVAFDEVLRAVRALYREPTYALAAFHPEPVSAMSSPDQAVAFLRRSPDPMIQAVRSSVLARIDPGRGEGTSFISLEEIASVLQSGAKESLRSKILNANFATLKRLGREGIEAALQEIRGDRDRSYAAILKRRGADANS